MSNQDELVKGLLEKVHTIAIVGLSPAEDKASNRVAKYLQNAGYRIIPVNPAYDEILGERSYKSLSEIPESVDVVDIFMRSGKVVPVVEEAVLLKPGYIWLQLGIVNEEARAIAEKNGIAFIQDKCMKQEHERLVKKPD
jgi:predicted CoA-binding protein